MRIAIIGAGFSGLATAKTLQEYGHEVHVLEQCPDLGGVWSATRKYPGLTTQSGKDKYRFSDMSMPEHFPFQPNSDQVQLYLQGYAAKHSLLPLISFHQKVIAMERPPSGSGWNVTTEDQRQASSHGSRSITRLYDHVVVANGVFSEVAIPHYEGLEDYRSAGGVVVHTSQYSKLQTSLEGKSVLVVGYGKSACDVANAIAETTASTTLIARTITWKLPVQVLRKINFKYLRLTRHAESLFQYIDPSPIELFWQSRWGSPIRKALFGLLEVLTRRSLSLVQLNLVPEGGFEQIATSSMSLDTPGFYEQVKGGRKLFVKRDVQIEKVFNETGIPMAKLSSGEVMRADIIICGTGFRQTAPFLPRNVLEQLTDTDGDWIGLHRHILPIGIKDLTFNGYNSSRYCAVCSEVVSLWIAAYLEGDLLSLPTEEQQSRDALTRFQWLNQRAPGKTAHGTCTIPFALRPIDDLLQDLQLDISTTSRWLQWVLPFNPSAYQFLGADLRKKLALKRSNQPSSVKR
jgi:dimethylaniline monooxygenase (N-oxide forming)